MAPPATWPSAGCYRYLDEARPADIAWEWLRRDPDYRRVGFDTTRATAGTLRSATRAPAECTARWGCLNLPDPGMSWREAPILWSAGVDPSVLKVVALPWSKKGSATSCWLPRGTAATLVRGADCEHLLLRAGRDRVRIDVVSGTLLGGPVSLLLVLHGIGKIEPALGALRQILQLCQAVSSPPVRSTGHQRLRRQVTALRVCDALALGASIRDVGVMLFGFDRVRDEWPGEALKSQCRRLIALARAMAAGGYRDLLR